MQVQFVEDGQRLIARPEGRMEAADGTGFAEAVKQYSAVNSVTIDLADLDSISFGGIRAVLRLARSLKGSSRKLDFLGGSGPVRDMLDQAGLDDFFPFTPPYISNRGVPK